MLQTYSQKLTEVKREIYFLFNKIVKEAITISLDYKDECGMS